MSNQYTYDTIETIEKQNNILGEEDATLIYFSHEQCNVCKVLKPKIAELLQNEFPKMKMYYSDTVKFPETAAQNSVFAVPTLLVFFQGKEYFRKSRNISVGDLENDIARPYGMIFDE